MGCGKLGVLISHCKGAHISRMSEFAFISAIYAYCSSKVLTIIYFFILILNDSTAAVKSIIVEILGLGTIRGF